MYLEDHMSKPNRTSVWRKLLARRHSSYSQPLAIFPLWPLQPLQAHGMLMFFFQNFFSHHTGRVLVLVELFLPPEPTRAGVSHKALKIFNPVVYPSSRNFYLSILKCCPELARQLLYTGIPGKGPVISTWPN